MKWSDMGKALASITPTIAEWITEQKIFFVSTAPLTAEGHINSSPKGADSFRVLGPNKVAYLDLNGSGVETIAHLRENGRIVIMFCAFEGKPQICRFHGKGIVHEQGTIDFQALACHFTNTEIARSIIEIEVERVSLSCGFSVPYYEYKSERNQLIDWSHKKGAEGLRTYQANNNAASIDGLPGLVR